MGILVPSRQLGQTAAGLSLAAGLIHLVAAPEHLQEWWGYGYFFLADGVGQVLYAQLLFRNPSRSRGFYAAGLGGTLAIIVLYAVTRTIGIPLFGPAAGEIKTVGALDVPSKLVEIALVAVLGVLFCTSGKTALSEAQPTRLSAPGSEPKTPGKSGLSLSRRALVAGVTGGTLGVVGLVASQRGLLASIAKKGSKASAGDPSTPRPVQQTAEGIMQVALTAQEVDWELAPGKRVKALSYNGQVPGPVIRIREGQRLRVGVTNHLSVPTTVHWHGLDVPNSMDGVPDLTQPAVQSGETFSYEFDVRPSGTRWYHTHVGETQQLDRGLYGALIVEPAQPDLNPPDREYVLVISSWVTGQGPAISPPNNGMSGMGRGMMMGASTDPPYDTMTVNGKAFPATNTLNVREGQRVRLRLINASGTRTHLIFLEGHRLRVTHTDGNALEQPVEVDVVPIAPAERYDVDFAADRPGVWSLHDLAPGQTEAGLRVEVVYAGHEAASTAPLRTSADGLSSWSYALGRGVDWLSRPTGSTRDYRLTLSGGMMGSTAWTVNGKIYPNTDPLPVSAGDLIGVHFFNMSMENHPMHIHGHSFRLTSIGGRRLSAPLIKDVVDVPPMGDAEIEFVADNPGDWMLHCHKPMHMDGGMVTLVRYQPGP